MNARDSAGREIKQLAHTSESQFFQTEVKGMISLNAFSNATVFSTEEAQLQ